MSLTNQAQQQILAYFNRKELLKAEYAIDATCGNGHDTLFLAKNTANQVFGFDVQQQAIENTHIKLVDACLDERCMLLLSSHADMLANIKASTPEAIGQVNAIMFNLGYLPRSDKLTTTSSKTTLAALDQSLTLLNKNGIITILCYQGHDGGIEETHTVKTWLNKQKARNVLTYEIVESHSATQSTPLLFVATR